MAIDFTKQVRDKFCPENNENNADAGQLASPQRSSDIVIRSVSERQPVPSLLGNAVAGQRNAIGPGSPGNRTVAQAGKKLSGSSMTNSPLSIKLLRKIDRLTGDDEGRSGRSLLRLHGNDAVDGNDRLAPLRINWLITVDEPIVPGELSRATPPPGALKTQPAQEDKVRIIEVLGQERLKTDFSKLSARPEANPHQAHWQAAEPARTQASGRRPFEDAMGPDDMPPRKRQKTDHREASTAASDEQPASARQTLASPRHDSPRTFDADSDAELSLSPERERSPVKARSLSWKTSTLKRKPKMTELPFKAWLANTSARGLGALPGPAQRSPAQHASGPPVSSAAIMPAESHGKPSSN